MNNSPNSKLEERVCLLTSEDSSIKGQLCLYYSPTHLTWREDCVLKSPNTITWIEGFQSSNLKGSIHLCTSLKNNLARDLSVKQSNSDTERGICL